MTFLELEKKCKQRRRAIFFKWFFLISALLGIIGYGVYFYLNQPKSEQKTIKKKPVKKEVNKTKKSVKKLDYKLSAILDLSVDLNESKPKKEKPVKTKTVKVKKQKPETSQKTVAKSKTVKKPEPVDQNKTVKKESTKQPALSTQALPSYDTCIKLSEKYYKAKKYKSALKWAKNANVQDNTRPESWIMSAKILYSLGKKDDALKILKIYYNYHKNKEVEKLIGEMNENK